MNVISFPPPRDRPVSPARKAVEDEIERLIAILDLADGDPDLEDAGDAEPEPLEPYLADAAGDLEYDPAEMGEPDDGI